MNSRSASRFWVVAVFAAMAVPVGVGHASTFRVYQGAPNSGLEWDTVAQAFTQALVVSGDHTIQIEDDNGGAGYTEPQMDLTAAADKNITLTALVAVTITNSGTGELFRNLSTTTPEKTLTITGASPTEPITLYSPNGLGIVTCGNPVTSARNGLLHLENVVFEKPTTAADGFFLEINSRATGQQYLKHVSFKGGSATNLNSILRMGSLNSGYRQGLYMEYVSFEEVFGNNAMAIINNMADIEAVRCTFIPATGASLYCLRALSDNSGLSATGGVQAVFRDCQFKSTNGSANRDGFLSLGETFHTVRNSYKFYRPQFFACGTNIFAMDNRPCEVYVLGLDDADQPTVPKVNLNLAPVSVLRYARLYGDNKVSFQHCWAYEPLSSSVKSFSSSNTLVGNPEVELINCDFTGTGLVAFNGGASAFAPVITIENSVLLGGTFPLPFISTVSSSSVPAQVTIADSTLSKNSSVFITANPGDLLYGPGSIFDGSLGTQIAALDLQPSAVPALAWTSLGTSGFASAPVDTIVAAPNLTTGGRLTIDSTAAFNAAVGSTRTTDVDNEARPQPAAAASNDLGADETQYPVTDLALSNNSIADDAADMALVGTISITDPDQDTTLVMTDDGGGAFALSGNDVVVANTALLNGVSTPNVTIEIEATDLGGTVYAEQFGIDVSHVDATVVSAEVVSGDTVRITFSRTMGATALDAGQYTLSGTGQGTFGLNPDAVLAQSGTVYNLVWNAPAEMRNGGDITIAVANSALDEKGGALGTPNSATDTGGAIGVAPVLNSVTPDAANPTNATDVSFAFDFSEPMQDFVIGSLVVDTVGIAYASATVTGGPMVYTVAFTGITGDGLLGVALDPLATTRDLAGNLPEAAGPSASVEIDHTAPHVLGVTALDTNPTNAPTVHFGVQFSEDVAGFDLPETVLTALQGVLNGAVISTLDTVTPSDYVVGVQRGAGDVTFRLDVLNSGAVTDLAGNSLAQPYSTGDTYVIRELKITTQTAASTFATAGDGVALTVGVTGGVQPREYQWYFAEEQAGPYAPLLDGVNNTLELTPVAVPDTGYYYVLVSDANESASSSLAYLLVDSGVPLAAPAGVAALMVCLIAIAMRKR